MFRFNGCPKCKGDLFLDRDSYGPYLSCVQCGRYYSVEQVAPQRAAAEHAAKAAVPPEVADLELAA